MQPAAGPHLTLQQALEDVKRYDADHNVTQIRCYGDADKTIQCCTRDGKIYAVNPYTGAVAGCRDQDNDFLPVVLSLHRIRSRVM